MRYPAEEFTPAERELLVVELKYGHWGVNTVGLLTQTTRKEGPEPCRG